MATKYWVGGNGNWSSLTNWRTTSGGAVITTAPGSADAAVLDANSSTSIVTVDSNITIQTLTCTGFTGTLAFGTNTISLNSTGTIFTGATTMAVSGTPLIILNNNTASARTVTPGSVTEANSISFRVISGTGSMVFTAGSVRDLDFTDGTNPTGFAGNVTNTAVTIYGNFKASTGMTRTAGTQAYTFAATSGTKTINTAGVTFDNSFTFNGVGGTWQLQAALTSGATRTATLTAGTLDLASYTFTTGAFSSTNSNVRTLAFGTGKFVLNGTNQTIYTTSTATNLTITGTPLIQATGAGTAGQTRVLASGAVGEASAVSVDVTAGADTVTFSISSGAYKNINLTGFTGTIGFSNSPIFYGNFDAGGATATTGSVSPQFLATSGTQTINFNGLTLSAGVTFGSASTTATTFLLSANFAASANTSFFGGTLNLSSYTITTNTFTSSATTARTLAFGTGKIVITGNNTTVFSTNTGTNLIVTGSKRVEYNYSGSTGTRQISGPLTATAIEGVNLCDHYITAGTDTFNPNNARWYGTIDFTGFGGTFSASSLPIYGDLVLSSVSTFVASASVIFSATSGTKTITSNGKTIDGNVTFSGVGGTWSLQDALTVNSTSNVTLTNGTLTTNGYALTASGFSSSNSNVRTLNLGASTVNILNGANGSSPWNIPDPTNMTLNAGTSSLIFATNSLSITFAGGGFTYYDITLPTGSPYNFQFSGANTFRNITAINPASPGRRAIILANTTTVTGVLSCSGSAANSRNRFASLSTGVPVSFVVASVAAISDVDFADITLTGAAAPVSGTRLGDLKGNTGITFAAGANKYWNLPAGGVWSDTAWALTSGGAVNANNFPLAQDTVIFDNTGVGAGSTISIQYGWAIGTFNASTLTNSVTFDWTSVTGGQTFIFGDVTLTSSVAFTSSGTAPVGFSGRRDGGFTTITSAGVVWPQSSVNINCVAPNSVKLGNNLTSTGVNGIGLNSGSLDLNGKVLSTAVFSASGTSARSIDFNGSYIDVTGNAATVWACEDLTNFSYTGTPTVNFTYSGSTGTRTINNGATGATESNVVDFNVTAGTDQWTATAPNSVRNLNFTGFSGTTGLFGSGFIYGNLTLSPTQTITTSSNSTTFAATSGTKTITTNGVTIDRSLIFNGVGGTWSLQNALTLGTTRTIFFYAGTLTTNGYAVTAGKFGGSVSTGNRTLNLGATVFTCTGGAVAGNASWQVDDGSFSYTLNAGTSTIVMSEPFTGATGQDFYGGNKAYYNLVYSGGQPSQILGSNTFNSISNSTQPLALSFEAGTTQTVNNFNISGTAGNLVSLTSATPGTRWNIAKNTGGKVLVSYVSITDSAATPAGYWFAPTSQGNVDGGNNTGWNFGAVGGAGGFLPFF